MELTEMKRFAGLFVLMLLLALVIPASAQEALGPGEGGPIIYPNFGGDPTTLNPLLSNDGGSRAVIARMFPAFIGIDPFTGAFVPGAAGAIASDWTISEDGRTYTFTIRDDWSWSDGTPFTSADIKYAYDAIVSGQIDTPLASAVVTVESVEAPDPQTVVITFVAPTCTAINVASSIPPIPSHVFTELFGTDYAQINDSEWNLAPTVTANAFDFSNFRPGEQITLVANQDYVDAQLGYVVPQGWIQRQLASQAVTVEEFLAGNITIVPSVPEDREAEIEALADAGEIQLHKGPSAGWQFLSFNLADPTNPQNGLDADGNVIDQGNHPIFGDVRVRQAFALSIDHAALNAGAFAGSGFPVAGPILPQSWAYPDSVLPWPYDPAAAAALLEEAGWIDHDNDPATPRVAQGALYAEDGATLTFTLTTFSGNPSVDASTLIMQDQVRATGFQMELEIIEFQAMVEKFLNQEFDAAVLFFGLDPQNPDEFTDLFTAPGDVVGAGFNVSSYNNPRATELLELARTVPGCDTEVRKELYAEFQQIIHDDLPWFFINVSIVPTAARGDLVNFAPTEFSTTWNIDAWSYSLTQ
jgi:peptide/nickel transport system substrate-binding protein